MITLILFLLLIIYHLGQIILLRLLIIQVVHSNLTKTSHNNLRCSGSTKSYSIPFNDSCRSVFLNLIFPYLGS